METALTPQGRTGAELRQGRLSAILAEMDMAALAKTGASARRGENITVDTCENLRWRVGGQGRFCWGGAGNARNFPLSGEE